MDFSTADADARHAPLRRISILIALGATIAPAVVGDGSTVLFRKDAGAFVITAFIEHMPARAGAIDLSALVQRATGGSTVLDAVVMVRLKQTSGEKITEIVAPATHDRATNKLLYASHVTLASAGAWMLSIDVSSKEGTGAASGELNVLPAEAPAETYWPYVAMVPLLILAFVVNRWLRRKRNVASPRARP